MHSRSTQTGELVRGSDLLGHGHRCRPERRRRGRPQPDGRGEHTGHVGVGFICSCTGPEASTISQTAPAARRPGPRGPMRTAASTATRCTVIVKDDGYNPSTSLSDAQTLVQQDHVLAIMDNSDEDQAWASYAKEQGVPVLGDTDTVAGYTNSDFFTPGTDLQQQFGRRGRRHEEGRGDEGGRSLLRRRWRSAPSPSPS